MSFNAVTAYGRPLPSDVVNYDNLDPGIREYVKYLRAHDVNTVESCQGGIGHGYPQPTVLFEGDVGEGHRALGIAVSIGMPVLKLHRSWTVTSMGEPIGPIWELVFRTRCDESI